MEVDGAISDLTNNNNNNHIDVDNIVEDDQELSLPFNNFSDLSDRVKSICWDMLNARISDNSGSGSSTSSNSSNIINANHQKMLSIFLEIKQSNRCIAFDMESWRSQVDKDKQKLDQLNLLYENYIYEKNHLLKEIHSTSDFDISSFEPTLVDDQYYKERMEEIERENNQELINKYRKEEIENEDEESIRHSKRMIRLQFELDERIRKLDQLNKLNQKKKLHTEINTSKQNFLSTLPKSLSSLAVKLSQVGSSTSNYNPVAFYLSKPLYYMYSSIISYQSSCKKPDFNIKIIGDADKALIINQQQQQQQQQQQLIDIDKSSSQQQQQQLTIHPLSLEFEYNISKELISIQFHYILEENIIVCSINTDNQSYLSNLFPNDIGDEFIQSFTTSQQTSTSSKQASNITTINIVGKVFRWAQLLGGLIEDTTLNRWSLVSVIMSSIEKRIHSKHKMERQINELKKQVKPSNIANDDLNFYMTLLDTTYDYSSLRLLFQNCNVEIQVDIMMVYDTIEIPPIFKLSSKQIVKVSSSSSNNGDEFNNLNRILLEKETIKSIELYLNRLDQNNNNNDDNNSGEVDTLLNQVQKLKDILATLSNPRTLMTHLDAGERLRRGKLRHISCLYPQ